MHLIRNLIIIGALLLLVCLTTTSKAGEVSETCESDLDIVNYTTIDVDVVKFNELELNRGVEYILTEVRNEYTEDRKNNLERKG
jgi:hypothetical protein